MIMIIILCMFISQLLRCAYNTLYLLNKICKVRTPCLSAIFYIICSFLYLLIISMTFGAKEPNENIIIMVFFIEPLLILITGVIASIKSKKDKQNTKENRIFSLVSGIVYFVFIPLMPILDVIVIVSCGILDNFKVYDYKV